MPSQNAVDNNAVEHLTTSQINALTPKEGKAIYDTDLNIFKVYNPNNPNVNFPDTQYEQYGINNDGVIKAIGYYTTPITCTFTSSTNLVNAVGHPMQNGDKVAFKATTGTLPTEITQDYEYFVINANANDFQISLTSGGSAFNFTDNGTPTTVFYDLSATPLKPSVALPLNTFKEFSYPPNNKLQFSTATFYPNNNIEEDSTFYNGTQIGTKTGNTVSATKTITNMSDTSNILEGMLVVGSGIPAGTTVRSVDSPTQITITENATATASGVTFTFYDNNFLENNVDFQTNIFRITVSYTKPSTNQDEVLKCRLKNPIPSSSFSLERDAIIQRQVTSGITEFELTTIADSFSIGTGYIFSFQCTSELTTLVLEDMTRFSLFRSRV